MFECESARTFSFCGHTSSSFFPSLVRATRWWGTRVDIYIYDICFSQPRNDVEKLHAIISRFALAFSLYLVTCSTFSRCRFEAWTISVPFITSSVYVYTFLPDDCLNSDIIYLMLNHSSWSLCHPAFNFCFFIKHCARLFKLYLPFAGL